MDRKNEGMNKMTNKYEELATSIEGPISDLRDRAENAEANAQQLQTDLDEVEEFVSLLREIETHEEWEEASDEADELNFSEYEYFAVDMSDLKDQLTIIENIDYELEQLEPERDEEDGNEEED